MTTPAVGSRIGRFSQLDGPVALKLQSACNFINAEIARVRAKVLKAIAIFTTLGLVVTWFLWRSGMQDIRIPIALVVLPSSWYWWRQQKELAKTYKHIVVKRVVAALGHGLTYSPEAAFGCGDFNQMDLFVKRAEKLIAEDEIRGAKGAVGYTVFECKATRVEGSGKNRRTVTIFKGLVIRLEFNKNFVTHTVVVPEGDSKVLGLFGESDSRGLKEIARMENVDFEKCFSVYCHDQQEARYLLTPKLMELLMRANDKMGGRLRASFLDNHLYVTVPQSKDRFDVGIFDSNVKPQTIVGDLTDVVTFAEQMVDTLERETRIWARA